MTLADEMRGIPNAAFAAALLRQLADFVERDEARLTDFKNSVYGNDKGSVSLSWEEKKS